MPRRAERRRQLARAAQRLSALPAEASSRSKVELTSCQPLGEKSIERVSRAIRDEKDPARAAAFRKGALAKNKGLVLEVKLRRTSRIVFDVAAADAHFITDEPPPASPAPAPKAAKEPKPPRK